MTFIKAVNHLVWVFAVSLITDVSSPEMATKVFPFKKFTRWRFGKRSTPGDSMEAPHAFPVPCPMSLSHLAIPDLHPFVINWLSGKNKNNSRPAV